MSESQPRSEKPITVAYDPYALDAGSIYSNPRYEGRYGRVQLDRFGIERADEPGTTPRLSVTFAEHFNSPILLADVTFFTESGYRDGCVATGVLGFATGRRLSIDWGWSGLSAPIQFDGKQFLIRETRQPITRCERLLLMPDGKASAQLCEADLRTFVEQQFGREASMPISELVGNNARRMPPAILGGRAVIETTPR